MIFNDRFLKQGAVGGKQAATALYNKVKQWAIDNVTDCPTEAKIVVRTYANVKGLANACAQAGIVDSSMLVEEFVRGFTCGNQLFDFTDVGAGKDRADAKINGEF